MRASQKFVAEIGHDLSVEIQRRVLLQPYIFHAGRNSSEIEAILGYSGRAEMMHRDDMVISGE